MSSLVPYVLAVLPVLGCGDPLVARQLIVDTRVLAARTEVAGDPARAAPLAGEEALVRLLVVGPNGTPPTHFRLDACVAAATTSGVTRCRETIASVEGEGLPEVGWTMPALDETSRLSVVGVVCDGAVGDASLPWPAWSCSDGVDNLVSFDVASEPNQNPEIARDVFFLGGATWAPGDCDGDAPHVGGESEQRVGWRVSGENRERIGDSREALLLSHFVTAGELDRAFSRIDPTERADPTNIEVTWKAPPVAAGEQRAVTFHFVIRDGRGGNDWASRTLCVDG